MPCDGFRLHTLSESVNLSTRNWMALQANLIQFLLCTATAHLHKNDYSRMYLENKFYYNHFLLPSFSPTLLCCCAAMALSFRFAHCSNPSCCTHSNYGYLACLTTMITTKMLTIERWSHKVTFCTRCVCVCIAAMNLRQSATNRMWTSSLDCLYLLLLSFIHSDCYLFLALPIFSCTVLHNVRCWTY